MFRGTAIRWGGLVHISPKFSALSAEYGVDEAHGAETPGWGMGRAPSSIMRLTRIFPPQVDAAWVSPGFFTGNDIALKGAQLHWRDIQSSSAGWSLLLW
ncbi:hypothetical protein SAMN05421783_1104 [Thiocapsa roseopersicina]|uniref:Uncharacterized protein n=1 Tax=Thiocapsa roseopersicina TaxID=1058 RepID=A0A1H2X441_THIRO|nr:hypothetical protein SAMN05421783_1104 [Thiocapsa roseopersicina]